jgi:S-(hydroxymethyl)glutathione dehydrogenase / alcohol dehydrogenase
MQNKNNNFSYPIKFKGLILAKSKQDLIWDDVVFKGPLKKGQVLVKIFYSGICGKQIEEYLAKMGKDTYLPHLLGHEGSGEVLDVGPDVYHIKAGDKVVLHWMKSKLGLESELPNYFWKNKKLNAGKITTFNEMSVVSSNRLTKIPNNSNLKLAALLGCGLSTGLGAAINDAKITSKDKVLVIGAGGLGLSIIVGAKFCGAKKLVILDKNYKNILAAKKIGAKGFNLNNRKLLMKKSFQGSFNKIFVTATYESNIKLAIKLASVSSKIFMIGVPSPQVNFSVNALEIHRGKSFLTSTGGNISPDKDIPNYLNYGKKGKIKYKKLIISTINPLNTNQVIKQMIKGNNCGGRNLIKF